jgi:hypothetical protein
MTMALGRRRLDAYSRRRTEVQARLNDVVKFIDD